MGTGVFPEKLINKSPPSTAVVTNEWSCTSTPPTFLHDVDKENFTYLPLPLPVINYVPRYQSICESRDIVHVALIWR